MPNPGVRSAVSYHGPGIVERVYRGPTDRIDSDLGHHLDILRARCGGTGRICLWRVKAAGFHITLL
jgi:hypothetical protein